MKTRLEFRYNRTNTLCYEYYEGGIVIRRERKQRGYVFKDQCIGRNMSFEKYLNICARYKCFPSEDHVKININIIDRREK